MARLQCRACGFDEEITWDGHLVCPRCRSTNCRIAVLTADLPDSVWERIEASMLASNFDEDPDE